MGQWKFTELNKLCEEKGIPNAKVYQNSLEWRWRRADYHADMASKVWAYFFKESFLSEDQRCYKARFSYEAHVEACIQSLHFQADILGQIINVLILSNRFSEKEVFFKKIVGTMKREDVAPAVAESAMKLWDDEIFKYIKAFCNIIKHRRLIKTNFCSTYGKDMRNESGFKFEEFVFGDSTYPQTWGSDILGKYRFHLLSLITEVGLNINAYIATL